MSRQLVLLADEDFIESCKDHDQAEFAKCLKCRNIWPEDELSGGICENCQDKTDDQ